MSSGPNKFQAGTALTKNRGLHAVCSSGIVSAFFLIVLKSMLDLCAWVKQRQHMQYLRQFPSKWHKEIVWQTFETSQAFDDEYQRILSVILYLR